MPEGCTDSKCLRGAAWQEAEQNLHLLPILGHTLRQAQLQLSSDTCAI